MTKQEAKIYNKQVFDNISNICAEKETTRAEVERALGFGNAYIANLRGAARPAAHDRLEKIADFLNVPLSDITGEKTASDDGSGLSDAQKALIDLIPALTDSEVSVLLAAAKAQVEIRKSQDSVKPG